MGNDTPKPVTEKLIALSTENLCAGYAQHSRGSWVIREKAPVSQPPRHCPASSLCSQVFQLAAHLVYWGKAIIIYPLCENNVYMLSPNASVCL